MLQHSLSDWAWDWLAEDPGEVDDSGGQARSGIEERVFCVIATCEVAFTQVPLSLSVSGRL